MPKYFCVVAKSEQLVGQVGLSQCGVYTPEAFDILHGVAPEFVLAGAIEGRCSLGHITALLTTPERIEPGKNGVPEYVDIVCVVLCRDTDVRLGWVEGFEDGEVPVYHSPGIMTQSGTIHGTAVPSGLLPANQVHGIWSIRDKCFLQV